MCKKPNLVYREPFDSEEVIMAFLIYAVILILTYIFYKWVTKDHDYFEKKGVKFMKSFPILGSSQNLIRSKRSFPEAILNWYNTFTDEKWEI